MNSTLNLNPLFSYYFTPEHGVVVSSLEEDTLLESTEAASLLEAVSSGNQNINSLTTLLYKEMPPARLMRIVQSLIAHQYIIMEEDEKADNDVVKGELVNRIRQLFNIPEAFSISLSSSYFSELLFSPSDDNTVYVCVDKHKLMITGVNENICNPCIRARLLSHRPILKLLSNSVEQLSYSLADVNYQQVLQELKEISLNVDLKNKFTEVNLITTKVEQFLHIPHGCCSLCQPSKEVTTVLNEVRTSKVKTTGFRTESLSVTYHKLINLVNEHVGIISKLSPYKSLDSDLVHNYSSGRNIAFSSTSKFWLNNHIRSASGGKGKSQLQAQVSALCEAVERYSMVHQGQNPVIVASYNDIKYSAINPQSCLLFSEQQYKNRDSTNRHSQAFHYLIPNRFDINEVVEWFSAYSLTEKKEKYLLSDLAYAQFKERSEDALYAYPDSNGCASGNNYLEAILQGSLELIERDAVAIWWYNMCERSFLDMNSIGSSYIEEIGKYYSSIERSLDIIDITTDIGIPTFVAVSYDQTKRNGILYGFGCHVNPDIAVERAVTELNQLLPLALTKRSTFCDQTLYKWMDTESIDDHPYLYNSSETYISFTGLYKDESHNCLESAVDHVINTFKAQDIELLAFNLTQADTKFPVVKMIAPSLRHFWRRTAAGRLFSVPVKMKWRQTMLNEDELNIHSITI